MGNSIFVGMEGKAWDSGMTGSSLNHCSFIATAKTVLFGTLDALTLSFDVID